MEREWDGSGSGSGSGSGRGGGRTKVRRLEFHHRSVHAMSWMMGLWECRRVEGGRMMIDG